MGEQATNYAQPYPAPQAQYNPQPAVGVPYAQDTLKPGVPETVPRGGGAPSKPKLGFLEGFFTALCCCCCIEGCCCDPTACF